MSNTLKQNKEIKLIRKLIREDKPAITKEVIESILSAFK